MRDTLIVVNRRFLPEDGPSAAYLCGAVQHVARAAEVLEAAGVRVGFVLYQRCESGEAPAVHPQRVMGRFPGAVLRLHFALGHDELERAFRQAVRAVTEAWSDQIVDAPRPLLYVQTSVLLPFIPPELPVVVTHHSPFVDHVAEVLGPAEAQSAFDWEHPKADRLSAMQAEGLRWAVDCDRVRCAEISRIQEAYLLARHVPPERVGRLPQPLDRAGDEGRTHWPAARTAGRRAPEPLVAVTAVSRLDSFKNVELFVLGAVEAVREGRLRKAVVIGGFPEDDERERLRALVPREQRASFDFVPRLAHDELVGTVFPQLAPHGVFVCSSRFDLVPYTALEAARSGVCTLVPDTCDVGAAEYIPASYRFDPTPSGLGALLAELAAEPARREAFGDTAESIRRATTGAGFLQAFAALSGQL